MRNIQISATIFFNAVVPIIIGFITSIWLGLLAFITSGLLNGMIGWILVFKYPGLVKPIVPYLRMFLIAIFLLCVTLIIHYKGYI